MGHPRALTQSSSTPSGWRRTAWSGPRGEQLPFRSEQDVIDFLDVAKALSLERVEKGTHGIQKVLLEKDGVRMHAAFRHVRIHKVRTRIGNRPRVQYRDDYIFEVAAYELSELLGMGSVPPTIMRRIDGKEGTLQAWIEDAKSEKDRLETGAVPEERRRWALEFELMHLFDNLIFNEDRNQGNILYGPDWKLWLIDHTRAFRRYSQLRNPQVIRHCERGVWQRLQTLDRDLIAHEMDPYLSAQEISALLKRREKLVDHIQGQINERGESAVLWSFDEFH